MRHVAGSLKSAHSVFAPYREDRSENIWYSDAIPDPQVYELARKQGRILLTTNVKDFRPLLQDDCPGIIGIPDAWLPDRIDTKLTALLMRHGPNYFRGRIRSL